MTTTTYHDELPVTLRRDVRFLVDRCMRALDGHPGVVGPMVVGDLDRKVVRVSFDHDASGDPETRRRAGRELLMAALRAERERREAETADDAAAHLPFPQAG